MIYIFLTIEGVLYLTFMIMDVLNIAQSAKIKFVAIALCFLYVFVRFIQTRIRKTKGNDRAVMAMALFFTVIADTQLLFDGNYLMGLCCFAIVQWIYTYRIHEPNPIVQMQRKIFIYRIMLTGMVAFIAICCNILVDAIAAVSIFYFVCFLDNLRLLLQCYQKYKKDVWYLYFLGGMILFVLCDICVGIYNIGDYVTITSSLIRYAGIGMWFFYLPSQVLLVLSSEKRSKSL